jgi:hypothetical protein
MYNPDADIIALIDEKTKSGLTGTRAGYETLLTDEIVITVPAEFSQKEASRWIKTSINRYVAGDFLFIDCDTIIVGSLEYDFSPDIKIGAIPDNHTTLQEHRLKDTIIRENTALQFRDIKNRQNYFNGGVIYFRDCPPSHALFKKWHDLWLVSLKRGSSQDMPSLNQADADLDNVISTIGGEWNCQIGYGGLPYLSNAKIIHYYATELNFFTTPYSLASIKVLSSIKKIGAIPDDILVKLKKPLSAFEPNVRIISDPLVLSVINSSMFAKLVWLRRKHAHSFFSIDSIIAKATRFVKTVFAKKTK